MNSISLYRLGGLALIAGPVLWIVFFLLQPGGLLIDNADSSDAVASITSFASNSTLTIVTSMVIALGLLLIVFGFYAVQKIHQEQRYWGRAFTVRPVGFDHRRLRVDRRTGDPRSAGRRRLTRSQRLGSRIFRIRWHHPHVGHCRLSGVPHL